MKVEIKLTKTITYTITKSVSKKDIREELDLDREDDPVDSVHEYIEQIYSDPGDLLDGSEELEDEEYEIQEVEEA